MEHCTVSHLTSTGPHRPGYHMGPTSGGSIGSQGMGDPVYLLAFCTAVPAVHSDMPAWYGALYCISSDLHRTSQTWIPYGTYFRRVHRIPGYGRPCVPLHLLLRSTCSTQRYGSMPWSIVLYPTSPPQDLTDLDTIWDLLQEGP